jgi:tripartite-type tricarboxylate transporter receptor subunit TctC
MKIGRAVMRISASTKRLRTALVLMACAVAAIPSALAQEWPNKPIRLIVSFAAGGVTDVVGGGMQPQPSEAFGQPIIIDNRPGAGGTVAEALLARAAPDGYTMLMTADSVPANPHLMSNLPYDTFRDLLPVGMLSRIPLVLLVNTAVPSGTVKDFIGYARANPGRISYASPGVGTSNHLYSEVFKDMTNVEMSHVAYKGGGPAMSDLIGGHVQALLITSTLAAPQVAAGKVKALAVTSDRRTAQMPNVPTFAEAGYPDFKPQQWSGLFLPSGTPPAVVTRVSAEFGHAMKAPEVVTRLRELGIEPVMSSPAEFASLLRKEHETLGKLIRSRNITAQ